MQKTEMTLKISSNRHLLPLSPKTMMKVSIERNVARRYYHCISNIRISYIFTCFTLYNCVFISDDEDEGATLIDDHLINEDCFSDDNSEDYTSGALAKSSNKANYQAEFQPSTSSSITKLHILYM